MHRDIKPANMIIDRGVYKICDYGLTKVVGENSYKKYTAVGTPLYQAPEVSAGAHRYGQNIDVFSTGVMIFECLFGTTPWMPVNSLPELINKQKT